jgi:DNA-binding Lrp family transcriptional regulator
MARAYILVKTDIGKAAELQPILRAIPGVRNADIVTGEYDLIVVIEKATTQELGQVVMRDIHGMPGVTTTTTFVVVA